MKKLQPKTSLDKVHDGIFTPGPGTKPSVVIIVGAAWGSVDRYWVYIEEESSAKVAQPLPTM